MRNQITEGEFQIVCSECREPLSFGPSSKIEYPSAFKIRMEICVNPCLSCAEKYRRPLELLSEALKLTNEINVK